MQGSVLRTLRESLLLAAFGATVSAVIAAMTLGVLDSADIHVPLSVHLFLSSDRVELSLSPSALAAAVALLLLAIGLSTLYPLAASRRLQTRRDRLPFRVRRHVRRRAGPARRCQPFAESSLGARLD